MSTFQDFFSRLNPEQKQAVLTTQGRLLILAGAGTGKTQVLTLRMVNLIVNHGIKPNSILGLTFTNKAAAEMRHRIGKMISPKEAKKLVLTTFHGFCMQVLREEIHHLGYTTNFTLCHENEVQRLISWIAKDLIAYEGEMPSLQKTIEKVYEARQQDLKPEEITCDISPWHQEFVQEIYRRLEQSMRAYNCLDFDHLLKLTVKLFEEFPQVLEKYQDRFQYVMIDEYQDTNPIQYKLASLLCAKYDNLCVVGDDDQSIYGWRGADVQHILSFSDAKVIKLEQNYRSTSTILNAANTVISLNTQRHIKNLWSNNGQGKEIDIFHAPSADEEAEAIVERIVKLKHRYNYKWSDFAILYRSNILSRTFEMALMKYMWQENSIWHKGIPYQICGSQEFYERREIKDLLAYLRLIVNPKDQQAMLRVINVPRRGIGEDSLDQLNQASRLKDQSLFEFMKKWDQDRYFFDNTFDGLKVPQATSQGIASFIRLIETAQEQFQILPVEEALRWLLETIRYEAVICEEVKSETMRAFKRENLQEFIEQAKDFFVQQEEKGNLDKLSCLAEFMQLFALDDSKQDTPKKQDGNQVSLITFHGAKGLEFNVCFLVALENHIIPHEKSVSLEEERRLMYVAITRAKKKLCCSMARTRKYLGKELKTAPSQFVLDIPKHLLKASKWDSSDFF